MSLRVLVGVDGSPFSFAAAEVAIDLAARRGETDVTALHVVNVVAPSGNLLKDLPGRLGFEPAVVAEEVGQQHDEAGREMLAKVKAMGAGRGVEVRTVLDHGAVGDRLTHHAALADLLVVGVAGETEHRFPGQGRNTIAHVVASGSCPSLLVRKDGGAIDGVVIGYDGSQAAAHAVALIRKIGPTVVGTVHAIYVDRDGDGPPVPLQRIQSELDGFDVRVEVVEGGAIADTLAEQVSARGANTLAVGFSGRSKLHDFVFGTSAERLLGRDDLHLLVAH